jgi:hypothetical protein
VAGGVDRHHLEAHARQPADGLGVQVGVGAEPVDQNERDAASRHQSAHLVTVGQPELMPGDGEGEGKVLLGPLDPEIAARGGVGQVDLRLNRRVGHGGGRGPKGERVRHAELIGAWGDRLDGETPTLFPTDWGRFGAISRDRQPFPEVRELFG